MSHTASPKTSADEASAGIEPLAWQRWDDARIVEHMKDAARIAGASLAHKFGELDKLDILHKGPSDFVSEADMQAEQLLIRRLRHAMPGIALLGEETGASGGTDANDEAAPCIVMDPLDGTNNFLHGIAHFSVALALLRGQTLSGAVIFNPISEELFWAVRGQGAYWESPHLERTGAGARRLLGSTRQSLTHAVLGTCFAYHGKGDTALCAAQANRLMPLVSGIRSPGSAALEIAYVAAGRFDAFWSAGARLDLWDIAAGILIASEAGCLASEIDGAGDPLSCRSLLVSAPQFQAALIEALAEPYPQKVAA